MTAIESFDENALKNLILRVLAWRVGDVQDLPAQLTESLSITTSETLHVLELICPVLDKIINEEPKSEEEIIPVIKELNSETTKKLATISLSIRDKCISFCSEHSPSLSKVLYHDWNTSMQVATESLGRIARPIASITMRIQPASSGKCLLPPLQSLSMDLSKDMVDALASGFDRLQNQLVKIVQ